MNDSSIKQALAALREASAGLHASGELEDTLREAFRAQHAVKRQPRRHYYGWIAGAVAASVLIATAVRLTRPVSVVAPAPPVVATKEIVKPQPVEVPRKATAPTTFARAPRPKTPMKRAPQPRELATDFFAIPYAPAMTQFDRGQLIRVTVPASSMRSFGLPVREERIFDRVRADVLLGEDGIARAIRFVR
jgi:hypothetical protein